MFISYAKDNRQQWLLPVRQHLLGAQRVGLIEIWEDSRIDPGDGWNESIAEALEAADIVLLLVSSNFTASEYCHREMARALARRNEGSVEVVWLYVDHCDYGAMPFAGLDGMPKDKNGRLRPLVEFNRKEQARHLAEASKKVRELAAGIAGMRGRAIAPEDLAELDTEPHGKIQLAKALQAHADVISSRTGVPTEVLRALLADLVGTAA